VANIKNGRTNATSRIRGVYLNVGLSTK